MLDHASISYLRREIGNKCQGKEREIPISARKAINTTWLKLESRGILVTERECKHQRTTEKGNFGENEYNDTMSCYNKKKIYCPALFVNAFPKHM